MGLLKNFMKSVNRGIWQVVINGYTIPTKVVDNKNIKKPFEYWTSKEIRKREYGSKAKIIIHSSLNFDESKEMRISSKSLMKELRK